MIINSAFKQMIAESDSKNVIKDTLNYHSAIIAIKLIVEPLQREVFLKSL